MPTWMTVLLSLVSLLAIFWSFPALLMAVSGTLHPRPHLLVGPLWLEVALLFVPGVSLLGLVLYINNPRPPKGKLPRR
ncbi:hypothetical protein ACFP81_05325 [Deinococcus lacus]|uniref:Uncharacterized protein n=1 Tax=Deinococcus lacus TaxID=392561 RepID=A0ABW1YDK0_9DEIO